MSNSFSLCMVLALDHWRKPRLTVCMPGRVMEGVVSYLYYISCTHKIRFQPLDLFLMIMGLKYETFG